MARRQRLQPGVAAAAAQLAGLGLAWETSDERKALAYYMEALGKYAEYMRCTYETSPEGQAVRAKVLQITGRCEYLKKRLDATFVCYEEKAEAVAPAAAVAVPVEVPFRQARYYAHARQEEEAGEGEANGEAPAAAVIHARPELFASARVDPDRPGAVRWDDVAGLEAAKESLREAAILPQRFPLLFTGSRKPWKGVLLYGPPGTGKSHLAAALASEAKAAFYMVTASDLLSKWQGESVKRVRALFEEARASAPSIIFIDEVEALCGARSSEDTTSTNQVKTEILTQVDGIPATAGGDVNVLLLGATNLPWAIDQAMRRRFERRIYIPLPCEAARRRMFALHSAGVECAIGAEDVARFAASTEGFSGSDIKVATRDALMGPVRRVQNATHFTFDVPGAPAVPTEPGAPRPIVPCEEAALGAFACTWDALPPNAELVAPAVTIEDFDAALRATKPSVSARDLARFEQWTEEFGMDGE